MDQNDFYVYEHWRPDKGVCFYVGKGRAKRAWRMAQRNDRHKAVVSKLTALGLCVDVRVVAEGLSETEAYDLERTRIEMHKSGFLANLTGGGAGLPDPNRAVRSAMSESSSARWADPAFRAKHSSAVKEALRRPGMREKLASGNLGRKQTEEERAKRSATMKGRKCPEASARTRGENNPFYGCKHSPETLARIAEKKRGRKLSAETVAKMRESQKRRRQLEAAAKPPRLRTPPKERAPRKHTPETIEKLKIAAKIRGVSEATREAHRKALTGRKRAPFTEETKARMRLAAKAREEAKRLQREQNK